MPTMNELAKANIERQKEWDPQDQITLEYRGNEMAGECGEACNIIKKLSRERLGIRGSRATLAQLAEELADVIICASLIASNEGIDLDKAVEAKFNDTSVKQNLKTRLGDSFRQKCADEDIAANEWIGIDLDGTLALYDGWAGWNQIGKPLEPMLSRVRDMARLHEAGQGPEPRIFTARVCFNNDVCRVTGVGFTREQMASAVQDWCVSVGLPRLKVTNIKDIYMKELWDDRAIQMVPNTGQTLADVHVAERVAEQGKAFGT